MQSIGGWWRSCDTSETRISSDSSESSPGNVLGRRGERRSEMGLGVLDAVPELIPMSLGRGRPDEDEPQPWKFRISQTEVMSCT